MTLYVFRVTSEDNGAPCAKFQATRSRSWWWSCFGWKTACGISGNLSEIGAWKSSIKLQPGWKLAVQLTKAANWNKANSAALWLFRLSWYILLYTCIDLQMCIRFLFLFLPSSVQHRIRRWMEFFWVWNGKNYAKLRENERVLAVVVQEF